MIKIFFNFFGLTLVCLLIFSCNNSSENKDNEELSEFNSDSLIITLKDFPKQWERFGIENNDTVSYTFCNASNPEFNIDNEFKTIQIIIGNELYQAFKIIKVLKKSKTLVIFLEENSEGIKSCSFEWVNEKKFIGKWFLNQDYDNFYEFLPKKILSNYKVINEECD